MGNIITTVAALAAIGMLILLAQKWSAKLAQHVTV